MEGSTSSQIPQRVNGWAGGNYMHWPNNEYDDTIEQLRREVDPAKRAQLYTKANDIEVLDYAEIPLVERPRVHAKARNLDYGPFTPWDSDVYNVGNWVKR